MLWKDGKIDAAASIAYKEAMLSGKLATEPNQATQSAELIEVAIASIKKGEDSITGQEISKSQSLSMLVGMTFIYAGGGYKDKKLTIPKRLLEELKNRNRVKNFLNKKLLNELAASGVKHNPKDIIMITKNTDGKSGLKHIIDGHAVDFDARGIQDIPSFLNETLKMNPIKTGIGKNGPYANYQINGEKYRVAYGTNGFIVSFYPID
ncbi:hypothetical protein ACP0AK_03295 [Listeria ivanovii]|uniref:hypothetical protein n=1 Tax=Listeria ivanovii TaxID=1638 RepID=UPI00031476BD|nr:hypothetical protein [Listeria ivanovii]AHI55594.1 hypothetical protein AX25_05635 [Listeria ivanovii WSLC3009]MCJ1716165.1 hypothetical protein [Listeria ivanovii]MCJ1721925.1 hypothetical protein [Listeria ivanovii]MCJ1734056.1 hypothetical protein [Listeria ivanovii]SNV40398.1 Uncharacterised protein [Listeria ivanovii subsp. ivanovii]